MAELTARTRIALASPERLIDPLCAHLAEHGGRVEAGTEGGTVVRFGRAHALFRPEGGALAVEVAAPDLEGLYFARLNVAAHVLEFAGAPAPAIEWTGDGGEIRRPPNFQELTVRRIADVTPGMRRISFSGTGLARFSPLDALHLNLLLPPPGEDAPQWPVVGRNGLIAWQDPARRPAIRKYTVRSVDAAAGSLDIDFVRHGDGGPGAAFAETARPGDRVGVLGPGGGGLVAADWYLLAGDETALPAIGRLLENLPAAAQGEAVIEVAAEREVQALRHPAGVRLQWLFRDGAPAGSGSLLVEAVSRAAFPADGRPVYAWAGCEFDAFRKIRNHLRQERGLSTQQHLAVAYWRRGRSEAGAGDDEA